MNTTDRRAVIVGLDVHRQFSTVTARNAEGKVAWRQRLVHADRGLLRRYLEDWRRRIPVILESSFGWEWMCEELRRPGILHDFADLFGAQGRRMLTRSANDEKGPPLRESWRATLKG